jgi:hypothetical protein
MVKQHRNVMTFVDILAHLCILRRRAAGNRPLEIEIGQHEMISAFVRAYDLGGTVYEGEDSYPSLEAALQDLEVGIKAYLDEHGI